MGLHFLQQQTLRQQQTLAPQLQQSLKVLQMNMAELTSYLYEASLENPIIDLDTAYEEIPSKFYGTSRKRKGREMDRASLTQNNIDWLADPSRDSYFLQQSLQDQLPKETPKNIRQIFDYLILLLDERGYLPTDILTLVSKLHSPTEPIAEALRLLQAMEPAGIGAADLRHCLLLQLERESKRDGLAITLVSDFLPLISERKYAQIAKDLHISKEKILQAVSHIQQLNPIPANGYTTLEKTQYIVPDITATFEEDKIILHFNRQYLPALKQNTDYLQILNSSRDEQLKNYVKEKFQEYKTLQTAVQQRENTLVLIVSEIAKVQRRFFLGPQTDSLLCPLSLADLANRTGLSMSTISRALQDKYIHLGQAVYPLKHFLMRSLSGDGKDCTRIGKEEVKSMICELIQKEDKRNPLSDQAIANTLNQHNIHLSRRGVAKYRQDLSVPGMFDRKTV